MSAPAKPADSGQDEIDEPAGDWMPFIFGQKERTWTP